MSTEADTEGETVTANLDVTGRWFANVPEPCEGCGLKTIMRFGDRVGHWGCLERMTPAPASSPAPVQLDELANITAACASKLQLTLLPAQAAAVLAEWREATGGLQFSASWVGDVGTGAYAWLRARSGAEARGIDGAEPLALNHPLVSRFSLALRLHLDWLDPDAAPQLGQWLTEYDVNGQYLAASSIELGTGEPKHITAPRGINGLVQHPGYVMLATVPNLDVPQLAHVRRAFRGLQEGDSLATTTARHLMKCGVELNVSEALVWLNHRRHLDAWYRLFRDARARLQARPGRAAAIALDLVKVVANTTLGGWMRSEKNHGPMLRRDWSDQIIAEAWVRELVHLERAGAAGWTPVGVRRDAAWFCHPGPDLPAPAPVELDPGQLGKWKAARHVPVTDPIVEAHATGSVEKLVQAIVAASKKEQSK